MFKKLTIAALLVGSLHAAEEAAQAQAEAAPAQETAPSENTKTLSESIKLIIEDLEKGIIAMDDEAIVLKSMIRIQTAARGVLTDLMAFMMMKNLGKNHLAQLGVTIEDVRNLYQAYARFSKKLKQVQKDQSHAQNAETTVSTENISTIAS